MSLSDWEQRGAEPPEPLKCAVCGAPLRAEDVRLDLALAKCQACNAVYDLSGRKGQALAAQARSPRTRPPAALPSRFQVEDDGRTLRIHWRWFGWQYLFLLFFCVAWDGFLVFWYGMALTMKDTPWLMVLFPVVHVAAGVGLTYTTLCGLFNSTRVEVSRSELSIRHGPLPWRGNRRLERRELRQLYGVEVVRTNKGHRTFRYNLCALDSSQRKVELLTGLEDKEQVLWLEQALERRLGIEDAPVAGEVERRVG